MAVGRSGKIKVHKYHHLPRCCVPLKEGREWNFFLTTTWIHPNDINEIDKSDRRVHQSRRTDLAGPAVFGPLRERYTYTRRGHGCDTGWQFTRFDFGNGRVNGHISRKYFSIYTYHTCYICIIYLYICTHTRTNGTRYFSQACIRIICIYVKRIHTRTYTHRRGRKADKSESDKFDAPDRRAGGPAIICR